MALTPKEPIQTRGVCGGYGNSILGHIFCFTQDLVEFGVDMYVFEVRESNFLKFYKNCNTHMNH